MAKFNVKSLSPEYKLTRRRIIEVSHELNLSHIGSCLGCVDLIDAIYQVKKPDEKFILSNGHAALALYSIIEKYEGLNAKDIFKHHGVHPDRCKKCHLYCSSGSLGQGLPIALGMAIANSKKNVYCIISDGECAEGSIWEALRIARGRNLENLKILVNFNGWAGYDPLDFSSLRERFKGFGYETKEVNGHKVEDMVGALKTINSRKTLLLCRTIPDQFPFLNGQDAHYYVMKDADYKEALGQLK